MKTEAPKISAFQLATIGFFLSNALFVGLGTINVLSLAKQDAWISTVIALFIGLIPIGILLYVMNYRPDQNILEKNKSLFGKWIGNIINIILSAYILLITVLLLWSVTNFAITMYLVKTPSNFIAIIFTMTAVYAVIKGIETISRTSEVLFFLTLISVVVITISLISYTQIDNLKPFLAEGIIPPIKYSFFFISYWLTPIIFLTIIPKNNIVNKHYNKYLIGGLIAGLVVMLSVYIIVPASITPPLAALYRFPAYYVQRKISIGGAIDNVENFLSIHWYFNAFLLITMGIYFLQTHVKDIFKMKTPRSMNITTIIIGLIIVIIQNYVFPNAAMSLDFMKDTFPLYISLSLFILMLIIGLVIFTKRNKKKA